MRKHSHLDYRPDIDGLRAVAVVSVVAFHAFARTLPGGFVGVDIFFVISGFLISGIIYRNMDRDRFSYADFYARRARRIFPALLTVLVCGLVAGWFLLLPDEFKALGKQTVAGVGFSANLLMWSEAGYFDLSTRLKPLLHLWSLGVEEQFYVTWPLVIAFLYRRGRAFPIAMGMIFAASFAWCIWQTADNVTAAFYSPLTRFWELMLGAALAYRLRSPASSAPLTALQAQLVSWAGVVLLALAVLLLTESRPFPGWWALLPVLGAGALISAPGGWVNRKILAHPLVVFVGLISYPLYLWHWVLLAFLRTRLHVDGKEIPHLQRTGAVVASFVLAWLTYEFVEKPIRLGASKVFQPLRLTAFMALAGVAGAAVFLSNGAVYRYPVEIREFAARDRVELRDFFEPKYRYPECFLYNQPFSDIAEECTDRSHPERPLVVLWGDSHAAALYPGLLALEKKADAFRIAEFTSAGCPPVVGIESRGRDECRGFNDAVLLAIAQLRPAVVVMEGDWQYYRGGGADWREIEGHALADTVRQLQAAGVGRVVVMGNLPEWQTVQTEVPLALWHYKHQLTHRTYEYFDPNTPVVDGLVRVVVSRTGATFVSPLEALCNTDGCQLTTRADNWEPVTWDAGHLTTQGSELLIALTGVEIFGRHM